MDDQNKKTRIIAIGNQKGGVGKTTNCLSISGALAERGKKCLVVDLDMQSSATRLLGVPEKGWTDSYDVMTGTDAFDAIITDNDSEIKLPQNIHLIPSSRRLVEIESYLNRKGNEWVSHQDLLVKPMRQIQGHYDYVFLDTPPQLTKALIPAYKIADYAILSCIPESESVDAISDAVNDIVRTQEMGNAKIRLLGIVVCSVPRPMTRLAKYLIEYVEKNCMDEFGQTVKFIEEISRAVMVSESQKMRKTIFDYDPEHPVTHQYRRLAEEIESRTQDYEDKNMGVSNG